MKTLLFSLFAGLSGAFALSASAQEAYPSQTIRIVVPFGPGSGTDIASRLIGQKLQDSFGRPVIVENKPGANGSIAAELVARAQPDGYTMLMGTNSTHGANPVLLREMRYDPIKNFAHINRVAVFTSILVVNPQLPVSNLRELIDYGKERELSLATGNASGVVQSETLARLVGWKKLLRVPFKSNPPAMTEVAAGRVDMMFTDIASAQPLLKGGRLRALAVTSKSRSALMPELPTIMENGVADFDLSGWNGLFAPAGTPPEIVERLNAEITRIVELPDVKSRLFDIGAEPGPMKSAEYASWVQGEVNKWSSLAKQAGIQPE